MLSLSTLPEANEFLTTVAQAGAGGARCPSRSLYTGGGNWRDGEGGGAPYLFVVGSLQLCLQCHHLLL